MTDIAPGWYPDPEDVAQVRYWDGQMWTEHRAPVPLANDVKGGDSMAVVTGAFKMFAENWVALLAIAGLATALTIAGVIIALIGVAMSLEPGVFEILDNVLDPNYNPDFDPVDRAFEDSIRWNWNAGVVLVVIGYLATTVAFYGGMAAGAVHLASVRARRPLGAVSSVGLMVRRLPRWTGILVLWSLVSVVALLVPILLYVLAARVASALFLVLVPATIAAVIYVWPFMQLSGPALVLAPRDTPPFRHVVSLVRANWGGIAIRCLVINIFAILLQIASSIINVVPFIGLLVGIPAAFFLFSYQVASGVLLYEYSGGSIDPEIAE